jgi:uncharacterized protein YjiK
MASSTSGRWVGSFGGATALLAVLSLGAPAVTVADAPPTGVDLATYVRVGRFDLPEPTRTTPPPGSLLAQEASAVTYNWDTDTLFIAADGGTSVVQVTKAGVLVNSMTLAPGGSPQGTEFYDTEGISYVGGGKFILVEERDRQVNLFTYVAGGTLTRGAVQTVKLGTFVGNMGLEGMSFDPLTGGYIAVKETSPQGIFHTGIDFVAGTATNGSPSTVNSIDLFAPVLLGLLDIADVFALSNLPSLAGQADESHLLVLSQESGKILEVDRAGTILSQLTIVSDAGNPLSVPAQGFEGLTMDHDGRLYVVSEQGGGDFDHPQLWVYAPSSGVNQAPTAIVLNNQVPSIVENTSTATRLKMADVVVGDDGLGTNSLSVTGADAASFEIDSTGLYLKAGTTLDYEAKSSYSVAVHVDDTTVGGSPDASATYNLTVIDVVDESTTLPRLIISEVAPWGSGDSPYAADWFEVTNTGATAANITGWKVDDNSNAFGSSVPISGVTSIGPGQSVIFMETSSTATLNAFKTAWFGSQVPAGFTIGMYNGGGVGLSTGGDAVNLFDALGNRVTGVQFGASTSRVSFDNAVGQGSTTLPLPSISTLSVVGVNGTFLSLNSPAERGSPGRITNHTPVANAGPDQPAVEATGPDGALVLLAGAASFDADGDALTFAWSEGSTALAVGAGPVAELGLGAHTLTLTATDRFGAAGTDTVEVVVVDTTAPAISGTPDGITVEATSSGGAVVTFTHPTAVDLVDGPVTVVPLYPSGSLFPVGSTLNTCTAEDAHGNVATSSFRVTVRDTIAPVVTVPSDIVTNATSPEGVVVSYVAGASDAVGVASFVCVPPSGSTFPIGETTVVCTATDAAGNTTEGSFTVQVNGAAEQIADLLDQVAGVGPGKSLTAKLQLVEERIAAGDAAGACKKLGAFVNEVEAQAGKKKLTNAQAAALIAQANTLRAVLGC